MARQFAFVAALVVLFLVGMGSTVSAADVASTAEATAPSDPPKSAKDLMGEAGAVMGAPAASAMASAAGEALSAVPAPAPTPSSASSIQVSIVAGAIVSGVASFFF